LGVWQVLCQNWSFESKELTLVKWFKRTNSERFCAIM